MAENYGASTKMKTNGRIVIPIEVRRLLDINKDDPLNITVNEEEETITIKKKHTRCYMCNSDRNLMTIEQSDKYICEDCIEKLVMQKG